MKYFYKELITKYLPAILSMTTGFVVMFFLNRFTEIKSSVSIIIVLCTIIITLFLYSITGHHIHKKFFKK